MLGATVEAILEKMECNPIEGLARIAKAVENQKIRKFPAFCYAQTGQQNSPGQKSRGACRARGRPDSARHASDARQMISPGFVVQRWALEPTCVPV